MRAKPPGSKVPLIHPWLHLYLDIIIVLQAREQAYAKENPRFHGFSESSMKHDQLHWDLDAISIL